jgi:hypothetical protein
LYDWFYYYNLYKCFKVWDDFLFYLWYKLCLIFSLCILCGCVSRYCSLSGKGRECQGQHFSGAPLALDWQCFAELCIFLYIFLIICISIWAVKVSLTSWTVPTLYWLELHDRYLHNVSTLCTLILPLHNLKIKSL